MADDDRSLGDVRSVRLDATSARGLAHPIRLKMLGILRTDGPATSTTLAERLGLNTGATSYHLRQLAQYGFIVEDPDRGTGRERWWRAAHQTTRFDRSAMGDESGEAFVRAIGQIYAEKIHRAIDDYATLPERWRDVGTLSDIVLMLTPDETRELVAELFTVMRRYRRHDPDDPTPAPTGAAQVHVMLQAFPDARRITDEDEDHE
jgi:predicted ArsR family transcriptional regulator